MLDQLEGGTSFAYNVHITVQLTLRSLHHHETLLEGFHLDFDAFFSEELEGRGSWFSHLESWWPHRNDANVLHARFRQKLGISGDEL
ncbi:sulfotransferase domain-containing protein [Pyxidicoccus trucidator]|uniref:sulfotransferase domain-containing protein n=1 Tax=Pyxidicoccus trucidator TaxID=2709662 RepID=UPI0013DBCA19|nr:sulfotransferase domain-containing protein [Pyxidicoccus trucidator]